MSGGLGAARQRNTPPRSFLVGRRWAMRFLVVTAVLGLTVLASVCLTPEPAQAGGRTAATVTVGAYDNYFEPKTICVPPGTTVRWVNYGTHHHTVTSRD